jgi:hypothetical protein
MIQREVTDDEQLTWTCVQAYAGLGQTEVADAAAERVESDAGTVPVVCTPRGAAQSVRLELSADWGERLPDDELLSAIGRARAES